MAADLPPRQPRPGERLRHLVLGQLDAARALVSPIQADRRDFLGRRFAFGPNLLALVLRCGKIGVAVFRDRNAVDIGAHLARYRAARHIRGYALRLAQQKARSAYYDILDDLSGFGRADLLASLALYDDRPQEINGLETAIGHVTAASVMATAREYLTTSNRTVYVRRPPDAVAAGAGR